MVTCHELRRVLAANSTDDTFAPVIPRTTLPSGAGIIDLFDRELGFGGGDSVPSHLQVIPFGSDANNETLGIQIWGFSKVSGESLWIPSLLANLAVTLGNVSGAAIGTNHFMADTIAVTDGAADNGDWLSLVSDALDLGASVLIHTRGHRYLQFAFNAGPTTETSASANAFIRPLDI